MFKICACCKEEKEITEFSKDKKRTDGHYVYCKPCVKEKSRQRYLKNKDKINKATKAWKEKNRERYLAQQREYGRKHSQTLNGRYRHYKGGAKVRNYTWELSKETFAKYWQKPCHYCGSDIDTVGIDRKDNNIGYIESNIVSCCAICNRAKDTMSAQEYIEHCERVSHIMRWQQ